MYDEVKIDRLMNLENAIFVCFGDEIEHDLPQVESADDAMLDALQDVENLTRREAECHLHRQV